MEIIYLNNKLYIKNDITRFDSPIVHPFEYNICIMCSIITLITNDITLKYANCIKLKLIPIKAIPITVITFNIMD
jgi:hypothetical protein